MSEAALAYLRRDEWTMGHGQCHECSGLKPGKWAPRYEVTVEHEGHDAKCLLANAIESLGGAVVYRTDNCGLIYTPRERLRG